MSAVPASLYESMTPRGSSVVAELVPAALSTSSNPGASLSATSGSTVTTAVPFVFGSFNTGPTNWTNFFGSTTSLLATASVNSTLISSAGTSPTSSSSSSSSVAVAADTATHAGGDLFGSFTAAAFGQPQPTATLAAIAVETPFPTPFEGDPKTVDEYDGYFDKSDGSFAVEPKYLKEMELLRMLAQIREKPEWWLKVNQPVIVNRWKKEMYQQATLLTPQTIEYGIQELKYQSQLYQQTPMRGHSILPSAIDGVVQNDQLIPNELLLQLKECLKPFEDVPESERDYHPGSDHQVIDLVHPSLYCLRYGKTKLTKESIPLKDTLRSIGSGDIVSPLPTGYDSWYAASKNFAWLPAEFEVSSDGSNVKINSYINNIHPIQHAKLYGVLESIFASFIPMFESVLSHLRCGVKTRLTRMNDMNYDWFHSPKLDIQSTRIFDAHLEQERLALKSSQRSAGAAGPQEEPFYFKVVKKRLVRGVLYDQFRATVQLGLRVRPSQKLSRPAQVALVRFQDRLAQLYLESTFEACTKVEGLLAHLTPSATNFSQPPYICLPDDLRVRIPRLLKSTQAAMDDYARCSFPPPQAPLWRPTTTDLGVFTEKMTQRWFVLFKRRLANLYPAMDQSTQHQYLSILLKKEYANLVRLGAAIQSVLGEMIELGGIIATRHTNSKVIELNHIQLALKYNSEIQALDRYLTRLYPPQSPTTHDDVTVDEVRTAVMWYVPIQAEAEAASSTTLPVSGRDPLTDTVVTKSQDSCHSISMTPEEEERKVTTGLEQPTAASAPDDSRLTTQQLQTPYDQNEANIRIDGRNHAELTRSPSTQLAMIQFQDRLARLYLESTFEACMKTAGLLSTPPIIANPSEIVEQPPLIDLYLPPDIRSQTSELFNFSHQEMTKAISNQGASLILTDTIALKWMELFKQSLPSLYPHLSPETRQQYFDLLIKSEYHPLIRLRAGVEYYSAEIFELGGNCAHDLCSRVIYLDHLVLAIEGDQELQTIHAYLQQRYHQTMADPLRLFQTAEETSTTQSTNSDEGAATAAMVDVMDSGGVVATTRGGTSPMAKDAPEAEAEDDEYAVNLDENYGKEEEEEYRKVYQPEVVWPFSPDTTIPKTTYSLAGRTLQVIVKLANIELTPEKPNYSGGAWHVEGMKNEAIVASGIYYINSTNITESRLSFRQGVQYFSPGQSDSKGPRAVYGLTRNGPLNQELGSVITKSGRAIAFPNIYQHQVQPFQLADPTLPGKRQILVFFLVDPTIHITSTANVPPQQRHWLKTATGDQTPTVLAEMNAGTPLIPDLINLAAEYHSDLGVIGQSEAFRVRDELMKERKFFVDQNTRAVYQRPFSFCEH